ncbi:MAG: VOC family protein [Alphaproteobacteria bacterium]|nr:VOC family protein [Alphaproteobacteria bacterium]
MTSSLGRPPRHGFARLVPELLVEDLGASLAFWRDILGFVIAYQRPEEGFAYVERPDGAQVMLCRRWGTWETGALERPFGRGVMFQIYIDDVAALIATLRSAGWPIVEGPRESWRRYGDREGGMREVFVQDPDGYLIMMAEHIGERPLG